MILNFFYEHQTDRAAASSACLTGLATLLLGGGLGIATISHAEENRSFQQGINLSAKVLLAGAYDAQTGLMRDALRVTGVLPMVQPYAVAPTDYSGAETLNLALSSIAIGGDHDALVDWVLLELRAAADPKQRLAAKALGVQRDGDLMDVSYGDTILAFPELPPGDYYVSIKHRNHLAVRTALAHSLSFQPKLLDFTRAELAVAGTAGRQWSGETALLWAGDAGQDGRIIAGGASNDSNLLFAAVLGAPANVALNASYRLSAYLPADLNLDGSVVYVGPGNDSNVLYSSVLSYPGNTSMAYNYIVQGAGL